MLLPRLPREAKGSRSAQKEKAASHQSAAQRSELKSDGERHHARRKRTGRKANRGSIRDRIGCRIKLGTGVHGVEFRMVERVVRLHLESEDAPGVNAQLNVLRHGQVEIGDVRIRQNTGSAAEIPQRRWSDN